ncbi:MAG: glycosyltransferase family 4 protein [Deltaproteobacteria bacterium]|nr:glycosyltransferase family 4 protein [Deltaproteobacteria bacterium]MBW2533603.1 glycosyltransferase family 4 protein [Deltaproteobacteria bacterium]
MARVLHLLSQRPSLTGSGITLDALVRHAGGVGWEQRVVVGVPADDSRLEIGGLPPEHVRTVRFGTAELPFPVPGMSDVMPYRSTRFSAMSEIELRAYGDAWRHRIGEAVADLRPQVIHAHHVWLMSSLVKDLAPTTPVVIHCHATGLRQMELCPQLSLRVRRGCRRADRFAVLHRFHLRQLADCLGVEDGRVRVVGAGFRDDLFHARGREEPAGPRLLYVGKLSASKGLPCLLDAVEELAPAHAGLELHVAGGGAGDEADALRQRMERLQALVVFHGQLSQRELGEQMRRSTAVVLPSFFEGLPLVLVEAFACGCRIVATALPGVVEQLAPALGASVELVEPPGMLAVDTPDPAELPGFTERLRGAIERVLSPAPPSAPDADRASATARFTWQAVFGRVESVWRELIEG